jgi:hypothetical protein
MSSERGAMLHRGRHIPESRSYFCFGIVRGQRLMCWWQRLITFIEMSNLKDVSQDNPGRQLTVGVAHDARTSHTQISIKYDDQRPSLVVICTRARFREFTALYLYLLLIHHFTLSISSAEAAQQGFGSHSCRQLAPVISSQKDIR